MCILVMLVLVHHKELWCAQVRDIRRGVSTIQSSVASHEKSMRTVSKTVNIQKPTDWWQWQPTFYNSYLSLHTFTIYIIHWLHYTLWVGTSMFKICYRTYSSHNKRKPPNIQTYNLKNIEFRRFSFTDANSFSS